MKKQRGSALVYVLVAIALIAMLTAFLMQPSSTNTGTQNASTLIAGLKAQIDTNAAAIQECYMNFPDQDPGLTLTEQKNPRYPINPGDTYYDSNGVDPKNISDNFVKNIRCPGDPGAYSAAPKNHTYIFRSEAGKFMPPPPDGFSDWEYYNGADGVFFFTKTARTDSYLTGAMKKLDALYGMCDVDVVYPTGAAYTMTNDVMPAGGAVRQCPANNYCIRYWVLLKDPSTSLHKDTGC